MRRIFLSYRREDSEGETGRLSDRLVHELGKDSVFVDVDNIPLGYNFVEHLTAEVARCDVLLAIIGPQWVDIRDAKNERRLDDPNDFVRIEITAALQRKIPVIPILIRGTKIPAADQLPSDLKELSLRSALDVRYASFHSDIDRLVRELKRKAPISHDNLEAPKAIDTSPNVFRSLGPTSETPPTPTQLREPGDTSHESPSQVNQAVVIEPWLIRGLIPRYLAGTIAGFVIAAASVIVSATVLELSLHSGPSVDKAMTIWMLAITCIGAIASHRWLLRATLPEAAVVITCLATWTTVGALSPFFPNYPDHTFIDLTLGLVAILIIQLALLVHWSKTSNKRAKG